MPSCPVHRPKNLVDETLRDSWVVEVAHRVHEDALRFLPGEGKLQSFRPKFQVESLLKWMTGNSTEPLGEPLSIAMLAALAYLCTPRDRVPSRVGPLYRGSLAHGLNDIRGTLDSFRSPGVVYVHRRFPIRINPNRAIRDPPCGPTRTWQAPENIITESERAGALAFP